MKWNYKRLENWNIQVQGLSSIPSMKRPQHIIWTNEERELQVLLILKGQFTKLKNAVHVVFILVALVIHHFTLQPFQSKRGANLDEFCIREVMHDFYQLLTVLQ